VNGNYFGCGWAVSDHPHLAHHLEVPPGPVRRHQRGCPPQIIGITEEFAGHHPQAKVIICGVNGEWEQAATAMKNHPNLSLETSCSRYLGMVALFPQEFGAERIMFGPAIPLQYPHCA
jgi:predicted TIM-barrel fold metal-dependent hydrolase